MIIIIIMIMIIVIVMIMIMMIRMVIMIIMKNIYSMRVTVFIHIYTLPINFSFLSPVFWESSSINDTQSFSRLMALLLPLHEAPTTEAQLSAVALSLMTRMIYHCLVVALIEQFSAAVIGSGVL